MYLSLSLYIYISLFLLLARSLSLSCSLYKEKSNLREGSPEVKLKYQTIEPLCGPFSHGADTTHVAVFCCGGWGALPASTHPLQRASPSCATLNETVSTCFESNNTIKLTTDKRLCQDGSESQAQS